MRKLFSALRAVVRRLGLASAGRRVADLVPLTPLGFLVALGAAAALRWLAMAELDMVLLIVGYAAVGLAAVSVLFVVAVASWLAWYGRRRVAGGGPLLVETGRDNETGFSLPALGWLPLIQLRWSWLSPAGAELRAVAERGRLRERVRLHERGEFHEVVRRVAVQDPFGLSRVALRLRQRVELQVLPHAGGLRAIPRLMAFSGGDEMPHPMGLEDGDRLELKRYVPGDPARFIHWKVFGRTRKLMIRMPERALSQARRSAAFFVAGPGDEASAAAARVALERELLGREWVFGTDTDAHGTSDVDQALMLLMRSREAKEQGGSALGRFVEHVQRGGPVSLVVFAPPRPGPWMERVHAAVGARAARVVIGSDQVKDASPPPLWRRLLLAPADDDAATPVDELNEVLAFFSRARIPVTVLDRVSGQLLSERHRQAMRPRMQKQVLAS